MKTLLKVTSSIYGPEGQSSRLAERFAGNWRLNNPGGIVVSRDLAERAVPHLTAERFKAFSDPEGKLGPEQQAGLDLSNTLIAELEAADEIVLAAPMYNFDVPSTLRAYFDHIARAGVTFRYTALGPEGLLKGKKTTVIVTRGGSYAGTADTHTSYLKQFLGFIGLTDIEWVVAEKLAIDEATRFASVEAANDVIGRLQPASVAAA
jgi:FMN-dependent NADH-azoreductase